MHILTKGLMGMVVAASVVGTAPAHAGLSTAAPAHGYSKADTDANFYRKKDRRYYASRDITPRATSVSIRTRASGATMTAVIAARRIMAPPVC